MLIVVSLILQSNCQSGEKCDGEDEKMRKEKRMMNVTMQRREEWIEEEEVKEIILHDILLISYCT